VGCGRGEDLIAAARERPGEKLSLVGLDVSDTSIAAARAQSAGDERLSFVVHDASKELPFEGASFDAVLSTNTLEAFPNKAAVLNEMHRVLRPGGTIVVSHFDWDSQLFDGFDKPAVRSLVHAYADWKQAWMADSDAWMGRRLWRTISSTGLFEGSVHPLTLINTSYAPGEYGWEQAQSFQALVRRGLAQRQELDTFLNALDELHRHREYFYSITMFVYVGEAR
jgi:SAM-dependent methyltransferase